MKPSDYYNGCFKDDGSVEIMTLSEFINEYAVGG